MKLKDDGTVVNDGKIVGKIKKVETRITKSITSWNHALVIGDVYLKAWELMELAEMINAIGVKSPFERDGESKPIAIEEAQPEKKKRHRRTKAEIEAERLKLEQLAAGPARKPVNEVRKTRSNRRS